MAQITINEVSQNYTYNIGNNSFCTVALPITASWGPGFSVPTPANGVDPDMELSDDIKWTKFPATQAGLESFISTYRGRPSNYRGTKDFSYDMAVTLMTAGYDVLVCRLCSGTAAEKLVSYTVPGQDDDPDTTYSMLIKAKYLGTYGNTLEVDVKKIKTGSGASAYYYWNAVVYTIDASGIKTALENLVFVFEQDHSSDYIPHISEIESKYVTFSNISNTWTDETDVNPTDPTKTEVHYLLEGGADSLTWPANTAASAIIDNAKAWASLRYQKVAGEPTSGTPALVSTPYVTQYSTIASTVDVSTATNFANREWLYNAACAVYPLLTDKLSYNPNRVISPGWDDQNILEINPNYTIVDNSFTISPLHIRLMDIAYASRCATGYIDIPKSLPRGQVSDTDEITVDDNIIVKGYAQKLARYETTKYSNSSIYSTHSALFAPWGSYTYVGTSKQNTASPSFQALLIQRSMLLNQSLQYEWALPSNRKNKVRLGKLDYVVPKKVLDVWQQLEGVSVNAIADIPELGTSVWGNSTLYEVPPATYQALANLSTRLLVNAVEDVVYRVGVTITFNYNNDEAYSKFYAGVTPILDTMKQAGAIDDYYVTMAADINGLDQVNANTVIGKIYLVVNGVINDIIVDLVALPPGSDLTQFAQ